MTVKNLTSKNFGEFIKKDSAVIDFSAEWCGPCKLLSPIFEQLADEIKGIKFGKVNVDNESELAQKFGIMSVPTLLFFKNGKNVDRTIGFLPKNELIKKIQENL